jgi:2-oxoglutarate ferredoxin oxidoreductase subunit delta
MLDFRYDLRKKGRAGPEARSDFLEGTTTALKKGRITIDFERCKECHLCIYACKEGQIQTGSHYNSKGYRPVVFIENGQCTGCTLCAVTCPEIAIEVYRG